MTFLLPFLALGAAGLYFLARHEGWLDKLASRPRRPRNPGPGPRNLPRNSPGGEDVSPDRLAVFEEFLGSLTQDDGKDQG